MSKGLGLADLSSMLGLAGLSSFVPELSGAIKIITDNSRKESEGISSVTFIFNVSASNKKECCCSEENIVSAITEHLLKATEGDEDKKTSPRDSWDHYFEKDSSDQGKMEYDPNEPGIEVKEDLDTGNVWAQDISERNYDVTEAIRIDREDR